jgi:hypothetical protein
MTIQLAKESFIAGSFSFYLADNYVLKMQVVQEGYLFENTPAVFDDILVTVELETASGTFVKSCTSIIGMEDEVIRIEALDKRYLGKPITYDNLGVWQVVLK